MSRSVSNREVGLHDQDELDGIIAERTALTTVYA